jgi:hypothetical protein
MPAGAVVCRIGLLAPLLLLALALGGLGIRPGCLLPLLLLLASK